MINWIDLWAKIEVISKIIGLGLALITAIILIIVEVIRFIKGGN